MRRLKVHKLRGLRPGNIVLAALVLILVVALAWLAASVAGLYAEAHTLDSRLDHAHAVRADLLHAQAAQQAALDKANRRLRHHGVEPVQTPPSAGLPGPVGPPGLPGPAPTAAEISQAVASYCTNDRCVGQVTTTQVARAVAAFCDDRGECRGPAGRTVVGPQGETGATGAQGPNPSDAQVSAAVARYCAANNGCRGPQGPAGQDGKDGADGKDGSVTPGTYDCGSGQYVQGFTVAAPGSVTLNCQPVPTFPPPLG